MSGNLHLHASLASYQSFRPNVYESSSSSRVTPDAISPAEEKSGHRHKSHRHHRHRSSHDREHHHGSTRRHAREVVQSARQLQPPTSFGDLLKQARGSKDTSPSHSRKGSIAPRNEDGDDKPDVGISIPPRRPLRPEDVELERRRTEARERDLRVALQSLSDQSMKTSRRLDDTYYSILEKVSVLRQTIGTLQELSGLTKELHENFETDTKELVDDVRGQFDGFDNFDDQQTQIGGLEERISSSKEKADSLTARLAKAKERVEARAKAEAEWETANSRRLRYIWGTAGTIAALIIALVLFHHLKTPQPAVDPVTKAQILEAPIPDIAKEAIIGPPPSLSKESPEWTSSAPTGDDRLRVFDEL